MKANQAAFDCGQLAERMCRGYYSHAAAVELVRNPRSVALSPPVLPGYVVPVGFVKRKDGTERAFYYIHFLEQARTDPTLTEDLERVWLTGSLLAVGDAASRSGYFDRAPELELLRHVRNGVAHGNRFNITNPNSLTSYPAHNRLAWIKGDKRSIFEIVPTLDGQPVLFDFMGPGDVLDLLDSVGVYLIRIGNGDPLRP
jgi:hypothetical protein